MEALLEGLTFEQRALERVAEGADGVGEDVVEHGSVTLSGVVPERPSARTRSPVRPTPGSSTADLVQIGSPPPMSASAGPSRRLRPPAQSGCEAVTTVVMPPRGFHSVSTVMRRGSVARTRSSRMVLVTASWKAPSSR